MYALPPANLASPYFKQATAAPVPVQPAAQPEQVAPTVVQRVTIQPVAARSDLLVEAERWGWSELRDYVVAQILDRFGPFPRDSRKEYGIFNRYFNAYGMDGIRVSEFAFGPVCEGWWGGAPISINRYSKASDPYFTEPILQRLNGQI